MATAIAALLNILQQRLSVYGITVLGTTLLHPEAFLRHKWRSLGRQLTLFEVPRLAMRQSHRAPLCSFRLVRVKYVSTKSRIVFRCAVSCMSHMCGFASDRH